MGKPVDTRVVEYAYVAVVTINPNIPANSLVTATDENGVVTQTTDQGYRHYVHITYELKDADKVLLERVDKTHWIVASGTDPVATYLAAVEAEMEAWIAADKLELSGYAAP